MTRDRTKPSALALESMGAEVVEADLEDRKSLDRALDGVYGVFGVMTPFEDGPEAETRQGKNLVDAAKDAAVQHFVYSSVGGADRNTGIPHFESKWKIEQHLRESGLPSTVIRPVSFMENFCRPVSRAAILSGRLESPLDPATPLQMIAVDDVGGFASLAFEDKGWWKGKAMEIAGDERTMPEVAEAFSRTIGIPVKHVQTRLDTITNADSRAMNAWFQKEGYRADLDELRKIRPQTMDLERWMDKVGWAKIKKPMPA